MNTATALPRAKIRLARWAQNSVPSNLQELLNLSVQPGLISFSLGLPAPELFPRHELAEKLSELLNDPCNLQYGPPLFSLRSQIVQIMARRGVVCSEDEVFVTTGAQQGISLLVRLLVDHQASVLLEEQTYSGALQALESLAPVIHAVPVDPQHGIDVDALEGMLRKGLRPALLYCIPEGHNPLSISMDRSAREKLVSLAELYDFTILEDDPYGLLQYEESSLPALRSFAPERVIYIGSFSKILAPGLRTGWVVASESLTRKLANLKEATDINCVNLNQRSITAYLESGLLDTHLDLLKATYRERRNTMGSALRTCMAQAQWTTPTSGVFFWVRLPKEIDSAQLLRLAVREGVAFVPGCAFDAKTGPSQVRNCLRLNFSCCSNEDIREGITRLGRLISCLN
ncbi:MAG TPA: PLP-dependent aminotransferase family protein [Candidatus Angelobacter sp.]|jgi:2-aminoadipate transaminase|nr:PLP-dependent aminotransferase family protein [Candidatus Angelobacter sp.]